LWPIIKENLVNDYGFTKESEHFQNLQSDSYEADITGFSKLCALK